MSVKILGRVWNESGQKLGSLLVLLAIADFADDDGVAFPSVPILAKKSRLSKRQVNYVLQKLTEAGELQIEANEGRNRSNLYRIIFQGAKTAPMHFTTQEGAVSDRVRVHSPTGEGAVSDSAIRKNRHEPSCIEPSGNRQDMSSSSDEVVGIFAYWKLVHDHPKAQLDGKRRKAIAARLNQYSADNLRLAIDGCKRSLFHQGANDRNQIFDDIELICRDAKHVDQFIAAAEGKGNGKSPGDQKIERILRSHEDFLRHMGVSEDEINGLD